MLRWHQRQFSLFPLLLLVSCPKTIHSSFLRNIAKDNCVSATVCKDCRKQAIDIEDATKEVDTCRWILQEGVELCKQVKMAVAGDSHCPSIKTNSTINVQSISTTQPTTATTTITSKSSVPSATPTQSPTGKKIESKPTTSPTIGEAVTTTTPEPTVTPTTISNTRIPTTASQPQVTFNPSLKPTDSKKQSSHAPSFSPTLSSKPTIPIDSLNITESPSNGVSGPHEEEPTNNKIEKPPGEDVDGTNNFRMQEMVVAIATIFVVLVFFWTRFCRHGGGSELHKSSSLPTRAAPQTSFFGGSGGNGTRYQGVAIDDNLDDDPDEWGWEENDGSTFQGDMELPKIGSQQSSQSASRPFTNTSGSTKPFGVSSVSTTTKSSASAHELSAPNYKKKQPPPTPKSKPADDIFSEMGLTVKPKFSKSSKSLGAKKIPMDTSWGDDDDLDDLLND